MEYPIEQRERAQNYLDIANVILVVINKDQTVELINKKGCRVLGVEDDEIIGKNWFDNFLPERDRERIREGFNMIITGRIEEMKYFENPVLLKSGEERMIAWHNTVIRDNNGDIIKTLSSGDDITDRIKIERKMRLMQKSQERIINEQVELYNQIRSASFTTYIDGSIKHWNSNSAEMYGYTRREISGKNISTLCPDETKSRFIDKLLANVKEECDYKGSIKMRTKNNEDIYVQISVSLFFDKAGKPHELLIQTIDLSTLNYQKSILTETIIPLPENFN